MRAYIGLQPIFAIALGGIVNSRIYLDHAATTPLLPQARDAMLAGFSEWANPSSPHGAGRRAKALLEEARRRIATALDWDGQIILTSGASEALTVALRQSNVAAVLAGSTEHDAVLRHVPPDRRLAVDAGGGVHLPSSLERGTLLAIQQVNSETGVIQPLDEMVGEVHAQGGFLLADCSQGAGKISLPARADMIAVSAHKLGGPIGIGALLVRDPGILRAAGGQEQGYRAGTEAMPLALGFAAALEAPRDWLDRIGALRAELDERLRALGGEIIAEGSARLATIASYRMPDVSAQAQLIRFDLAGIAVSAGSACSSGSLRTSHVLAAMGWEEGPAAQVIRVTMGQATTQAEIDAFLDEWQAIRHGNAKK